MNKVNLEPFDAKKMQGKTLIVTLPLRKNIPEPKHEWKPAVCPVCNAECWYNPVGEDTLKQFDGNISYMCTGCALKHR